MSSISGILLGLFDPKDGYLVSCLAYSTLMTEAICSSETSVDFQRATRRYIPEDSTLHKHRCENLKSYLSVSLWLYSPCGPWLRFQFLNLYTVGRTPWTGDKPVARPLPTRRTTNNKCRQTTMARVVLEPTIPVFERAKTFHALDRAATVIGTYAVLYLYSKGARFQSRQGHCAYLSFPSLARQVLG
jgi:hypothetical protein